MTGSHRGAIIGYGLAAVACLTSAWLLPGWAGMGAAAALGASLLGLLDTALRTSGASAPNTSAAIVVLWCSGVVGAHLVAGGVADAPHWSFAAVPATPVAARLADAATWMGLRTILAATLPAFRSSPAMLLSAAFAAVLVVWTALDGAPFRLWAPDGELLWATVTTAGRQPIVMAEPARGGLLSVLWSALCLGGVAVVVAFVGRTRPNAARVATISLAIAWMVAIGISVALTPGLDGAALADAVHDALSVPSATAAPVGWPSGVASASWGWTEVALLALLSLPALCVALFPSGHRADDAAEIGWTWIGVAVALAGAAVLQDQTLTSHVASPVVPLLLVVGALQAAAAMAAGGGAPLRVLAAWSAWAGGFVLLLTGLR